MKRKVLRLKAFMRLRLWLISGITFCCLSAHAQMGKLFDADKQMSSSFTTQIYLDNDGFIWVATRNGLNRYDGYQFRIIKKEMSQNPGMASNYVNAIMQDRHGLFYIGMYGALQTYDGHQFQDVTTYDLDGHSQPNYITCLFERSNGDVLVGTSGHGLLKMDKSKREARQIGGVLTGLLSVHRILEDSKGYLWLVTESQGLWCYDGKTIRRFFQGEQEMSSVLDICEDKQGHIYIATSNAGMFKLDDNWNPKHIDATGSKHISTLFTSKDNHIMIGYDGLGLAIYDPKTGSLTDNPYYSREVDLSTAKVYSICEDHNGNIWLGLLQKGIYMHPAKTTGFNYMGYATRSAVPVSPVF